MKTMATALAAVAVLVLAGEYAAAQQQILAINQITVPANADVLVSVPVPNQKIGEHTVGTKTANGITVDGASFETDQYQDMYYVRMMTGDAAGLWSTISSNNATELVLNNSDVLDLINSGDAFRIYKHQTIGSVFPDSMLGTSFVGGTQVLTFSNGTLGINRSSDVVATCLVTPSGPVWTEGFNVADDTVLAPETQFIIRNNASKVLTMVISGPAPDYPVAFLVPSGVQHDLMVSTGYPVPIRMRASGIGGVGGRQLLLFDNTETKQNKSAESVYTFLVPPGSLGLWADGFNPAPATALEAGEAFTVRVNSESSATKITVPKPY